MSPDRPTRTLDFSGGLDPGFLRRVFAASAVLSVVGALVAWSRLDVAWGLGFGAFGLWATVNIWALSRLLGLVVRPERDGLLLLGWLGLKALLYAVGFLLLWRGGFPPVSIVSGISIPLVVIFLKVLGRILSPRLANPSPDSR